MGFDAFVRGFLVFYESRTLDHRQNIPQWSRSVAEN